jgi:hypothetical protein
LLVSALLLVFAHASQADFSISDSTFSDSDWPLFLTLEFGDNAGSANGQDVISGNLAPSRLHVIGTPGSPTDPGYFIASFYGAAVYDPSVEGAISSIDWSFDWRRGNDPNTSTIAPAIYQGGIVFNASELLNTVFYEWQTDVRFGLTEADFPGIDFSANGDPIYFGYRWYAGTFNGLMNMAIDNFSVEVTSQVVPEASSMALCGFAMLAGVIGIRHRANRDR